MHAKDVVFWTEVVFDKYTIEYEREVYGVLSIIGDLGGVFDLIVLVFSYFFCPWSTLTFNFKAFNKLY